MGCREAATVLLLGVLALAGTALPAQGSFFEDFSSGWKSRWTHSSESKYNGKFTVATPEGLETPGLKVPEKAKHYGIAAKLDAPISAASGLVLQFELKLSEGLTCGGAYLKYLTSGKFEVSGLKDDTPYTVMFGPDKCGSTNKVHLILRHKSPKGKIEEKHLKSPPLLNLDKKTHVYTAVLYPKNSSYDVLIDGESKKSGSLFDDFEPSINPSEEIDDPKDTKPSDWVENPKIPDPKAKKPADWDEDAPKQIEDPEAEKPEGWLDDDPEEIDDPEASQPEDWDEDEDGAWEAPKVKNPQCEEVGCGEWKPPLIPNPKYKGKWTAELIDNPDYKGVWKPRKIANPDYFVDKTPLKNLGDIGGVAIEIWTMDDGYYFSDIYVGSDPAEAAEYRESHWEPKRQIEDKQAEDEAEKLKAEQDAKAAEDEGVTLADRIVGLFDHPPLAAIKPHIEPLLDALEERPSFAYLVVAGPLLLLLSLLRRLFRKKRAPAAKQPTTRQAKKGDVTGPDDSIAGKAKSAAAKASEAAGSVTDTTEDDEDETGKQPTARQRTRRADQ